MNLYESLVDGLSFQYPLRQGRSHGSCLAADVPWIRDAVAFPLDEASMESERCESGQWMSMVQQGGSNDQS